MHEVFASQLQLGQNPTAEMNIDPKDRDNNALTGVVRPIGFGIEQIPRCGVQAVLHTAGWPAHGGGGWNQRIVQPVTSSSPPRGFPAIQPNWENTSDAKYCGRSRHPGPLGC